MTDEFWLALAPAAAEDGRLSQFRKDYTDTMPTIVGFLASTRKTRDVTLEEFEAAVQRLQRACDDLLLLTERPNRPKGERQHPTHASTRSRR